MGYIEALFELGFPDPDKAQITRAVARRVDQPRNRIFEAGMILLVMVVSMAFVIIA